MASDRLWVGSIVIDCDDFPKMLRFWQEALHYSQKYPASDDWVILRDPRGAGPNVSLSRSSEGHLEEYRMHLDLYSGDAEGEVRRLIGLGAKMVSPRQEGRDFATLADPDGNLFDVIYTDGLKFGER